MKYYILNTDPDRQHMQIAGFVRDGAAVLDVGCGSGTLGYYLKEEKSCFVYGVDNDYDSVETAREVHKIKALCLDLDRYTIYPSLFRKEFDVVILADILEHLRDPKKVLEASIGCLRKNGDNMVLVSIPNILWYKLRFKMLFGHFDYEEYGPLDRTHLKFFTHESARDLLKSCGLIIVEEKYSIKPGNILMRTLAKISPGLFAYQFVFRCKRVVSNEV